MLKNYVIVDLETTGLRADTDKIIEIGEIVQFPALQLWKIFSGNI